MSSPDEPLLLSAEYFQRLSDGAPVMIWMSGLDMGCFYFNRAWLDFVGRPLEKEIGNGWAEGVHPEDLERCVEHYVSCFQRRLPFAMSYRLRHHSGEFGWILDRGSPHHAPSGEFLGYFGGCAELADENVLSRHTHLGDSLAKIRAFAGTAAEDQGTVARGEEPLELAVRRLLNEREADRIKIEWAASGMQTLSRDMVGFGGIARGVCLPNKSASAA